MYIHCPLPPETEQKEAEKAKVMGRPPKFSGRIDQRRTSMSHSSLVGNRVVRERVATLDVIMKNISEMNMNLSVASLEDQFKKEADELNEGK
jgi:hypothetical protein